MQSRVVFFITVAVFGLLHTAHGLVGGSPSTRGLFPSNVSTRSAPESCGGVAISPKQILTAAHCVLEENGEALYKSGTTIEFRHGDDENLNPRFLLTKQAVKSIAIHPSYLEEIKKNKSVIETSKNEHAFDLAIISFEKNLGLPPASIGNLNGSVVTFTGGGCQAAGGITSTLVRYGDLMLKESIETIGVCENSLEKKVSACEGDSGSPVYQNGKVIGIVRGGSAFGDDGHAQYSAFTIIDTNWVKKNTSP